MKDYLIGLLLSGVAIFAPVKSTLITTIVLILVDLISGLVAAMKKKQTISSAALRRTVTKFTVYLSAIMVGYLAETYMLEGFIPVSKIAAGLISVVELKSILENLNTINGSPIFKTLILKLGSENDKPSEAIPAPVPVVIKEQGEE